MPGDVRGAWRLGRLRKTGPAGHPTAAPNAFEVEGYPPCGWRLGVEADRDEPRRFSALAAAQAAAPENSSPTRSARAGASRQRCALFGNSSSGAASALYPDPESSAERTSVETRLLPRQARRSATPRPGHCQRNGAPRQNTPSAAGAAIPGRELEARRPTVRSFEGNLLPYGPRRR